MESRKGKKVWKMQLLFSHFLFRKRLMEIVLKILAILLFDVVIKGYTFQRHIMNESFFQVTIILPFLEYWQKISVLVLFLEVNLSCYPKEKYGSNYLNQEWIKRSKRSVFGLKGDFHNPPILQVGKDGPKIELTMWGTHYAWDKERKQR